MGQVQAGQQVLVNGAGGVGTFAVQIAAALGAEVTGVCSARNAELVRSLGAAHVIDYASEDFADGRIRYDVILDNVSNLPVTRLRRALTARGTLVLNGGGSPGQVFGPVAGILRAVVVNPVVSQRLRPLPSRQNRGRTAGRDWTHRGRQGHADRRPDLPPSRAQPRACVPSSRGTRAASSSSPWPERAIRHTQFTVIGPRARPADGPGMNGSPGSAALAEFRHTEAGAKIESIWSAIERQAREFAKRITGRGAAATGSREPQPPGSSSRVRLAAKK